ncbi:MAG: hypothetical protein ACRYE8_02390 [Janthinobacterium lividum]
MIIIRCVIDQAIKDSHDPKNEEITALLPIAIKTIKKLADSHEGVKELKRLEATDLDIAFADKEMSIKKFAEFFSEYYGSTSHISGNYKGEFIQYMPVKDFHEQLISNNLEAPILETNINDDIIGLGETIFDHVELYS